MPIGAIGFLVVYILGMPAKRRERRLASPWAFIGGNAMYCGGDFNYWGDRHAGPPHARPLPGPPPILDWSRRPGAQNAAAAMRMLTAATGRPAAVSIQQQRRLIPVPPGAEGQAAKLAETLMSLAARPRAVALFESWNIPFYFAGGIPDTTG